MTTPNPHPSLAQRREAIFRTAAGVLRRRRRRRAALRAVTVACLAVACATFIALNPRTPTSTPNAPAPIPQRAEQPRQPEPAIAIAEAPPHAAPLFDPPPASRATIQELTDAELLQALADAGYRTGLVQTADEAWLVGDPIPTVSIRLPTATPAPNVTPDTAGRSRRFPQNQR